MPKTTKILKARPLSKEFDWEPSWTSVVRIMVPLANDGNNNPECANHAMATLLQLASIGDEIQTLRREAAGRPIVFRFDENGHPTIKIVGKVAS